MWPCVHHSTSLDCHLYVKEGNWAGIFLRFSPVLQFDDQVATILLYWERAMYLLLHKGNFNWPVLCSCRSNNTKTNKKPHLGYYQAVSLIYKLSWLICSKFHSPLGHLLINTMTTSLEQRFLQQYLLHFTKAREKSCPDTAEPQLLVASQTPASPAPNPLTSSNLSTYHFIISLLETLNSSTLLKEQKSKHLFC